MHIPPSLQSHPPALFFRRVRALARLACALIFAAAFPLKAADPDITQTQGRPVRPLAHECVYVAQSPDPKRVFLTAPTILALPGGRLVVSYAFRANASQKENTPENPTVIATSDDHGKTWQERHRADIKFARLFAAGDKIYLLGKKGDLCVTASADNGGTWGPTVNLTQGKTWHQSACNVWKTRGNIYLIMETHTGPSIKGWPVGRLAPVLLRAKETDDLTKPEAWSFSNGDMAMETVIPGYQENRLPFEYFGVPFYRQNFPYPSFPTRAPDGKTDYEHVTKTASQGFAGRGFSPMGWLESGLVQIEDPDHYWHDPTGRTFHIFMRTNTGGTGYAAVLKAVEKEDGSMEVGFEHAPSGKIMLFVPFPGGQMRFHLLYDKETKLYWLLSTQATDSMARIETMPPQRFDLPNNERQRLVLHFSKNMVDWCFAGLVDKVDSPKASRHYASMDIDGNDLVIVSRSGDANASTAHNGNLVTFHRVKNFRDLVY